MPINTVQLSFVKYEKQLLNLIKQNLNPALLRRVAAEDVVQETLIKACEKISYFENNPEIPVYLKLRKLALQTITDLERKHLKSKKRDIYKEIYVDGTNDCSKAEINWNMFEASITSPSVKLSRECMREIIKKAMEMLPFIDRQIIELRHFDDISNKECAEVLEITEKAASIRYVRALQKLKKILNELTGEI